MKVLEAGKVGEKWVIQHRCTGWGNGGKGCDALLEIEYSDLRFYEGQDFSWRISEPAVCFKCPCCGKITDLGRNDWPTGYHSLPPWTSQWNSAKPANLENNNEIYS